MRKFILGFVVVFSFVFDLGFNVRAQENGYITVNRGVGISHRDMTGIDEVSYSWRHYFVFKFENFLTSKFGIDRVNSGYYDKPVTFYDDYYFPNGKDMVTLDDLASSTPQWFSFTIIDNDLFIYKFRSLDYESIYYNSQLDSYMYSDTRVGEPIRLNEYLNSQGFYLDIEITIPAGDLDYDEIFSLGYEAGKEHGIDIGYEEGKNAGIDIGYDEGYDEGYDVGYDEGYDKGYSKGQMDDFNGLVIITSGIFGFLSVIGNFQLLPGFKVGHLVGITMFFGLIYFIIGKKR